MTKILCVGSSCKDIFFPTKEGNVLDTPDDITSQKKISFELGAKYQIKKTYEALGGCAANVAVGLSRLGIEASVASCVGGDLVGEWIKNELEVNSVETEFLVLKEKMRSDLSAIIVDEGSADRVIFSNKNTGGGIDFDAKKIQNVEWIFLGDIHGRWEEEMETIVEQAKEENKKIAYNPRELHIKENAAEVIEVIGLSDAVFLNKDEAIEILAKMHGDFSLEELNDEKFLLRKIMELEPKIAVLTDGKRGAWASDGEKTFFVEGLNVLAVDSTGAGDSFLSGFLSAYIKGKKTPECLSWGIANSASSVQFFGAIQGLLSEEKILEEAGKIKIEEIK